MPSSVFHKDIPYLCLYPDKLIFSLTLCVFDCVCFVQDLRPGLHKLSSRSVKCIFMGYSRTQKEYRCYDPMTRKYHTSMDVIFFDSTLYFSNRSLDITIEHMPLPQPIGSVESVPVRVAAKSLQVYIRRHRS